MTYIATLAGTTDPQAGQIDAQVTYSNGTRSKTVSYTLKGENATRHALRTLVAAEVDALNSAEVEATRLAERVGGNILTFACDCGRSGCTNDGRHWLRPPG